MVSFVILTFFIFPIWPPVAILDFSVNGPLHTPLELVFFDFLKTHGLRNKTRYQTSQQLYRLQRKMCWKQPFLNNFDIKWQILHETSSLIINHLNTNCPNVYCNTIFSKRRSCKIQICNQILILIFLKLPKIGIHQEYTRNDL